MVSVKAFKCKCFSHRYLAIYNISLQIKNAIIRTPLYVIITVIILFLAVNFFSKLYRFSNGLLPSRRRSFPFIWAKDENAGVRTISGPKIVVWSNMFLKIYIIIPLSCLFHVCLTFIISAVYYVVLCCFYNSAYVEGRRSNLSLFPPPLL